MRTATKHPAKFSEPIMEALDRLITKERRNLGRAIAVLDPFAGTGRVHDLGRPGQVVTAGVEIEPEWACVRDGTVCADAIEWMTGTCPPANFDVVVTSPCYGNRLADHHEAKDGSTRRSYRHDLGRMPTPGSAATLPYGPEYRAFHVRAWLAAVRVLRPGGLFLLNVSDFVKAGEQVPVTEFHRGAMLGAGFVEAGRDVRIETRRLRFGANHNARVGHESVLQFRRPMPDRDA